jgi:hypothetical protein
MKARHAAEKEPVRMPFRSPAAIGRLAEAGKHAYRYV